MVLSCFSKSQSGKVRVADFRFSDSQALAKYERPSLHVHSLLNLYFHSSSCLNKKIIQNGRRYKVQEDCLCRRSRRRYRRGRALRIVSNFRLVNFDVLIGTNRLLNNAIPFQCIGDIIEVQIPPAQTNTYQRENRSSFHHLRPPSIILTRIFLMHS